MLEIKLGVMFLVVVFIQWTANVSKKVMNNIGEYLGYIN